MTEKRWKGWVSLCIVTMCMIVIRLKFKKIDDILTKGTILEERVSSNDDDQREKNIILVIADDMGNNDVGYNDVIGDVATPEIDSLAREGIILEKYYSASTCTPARGAMMTGVFQSKLGLQHGQIFPEEPWGLPLRFHILPEVLKKEKGYTNIFIGKWHLGHYTPASLPTARGFDTFFGGLDGAQYYSTHVDAMRCMLPKELLSHGSQDYQSDKATILEHGCFFDLRDNTVPVQDHFGSYSTRLFANKAQQSLSEHFGGSDTPLFLVVSFNGVHAPISVPDDLLLNTKVTNGNRRTFLAALTEIDTAVGKISQSVRDLPQAHAENTILIFLSDNGANPEHGGSNQPLRGSKGFLFEGGVRVPAFIHDFHSHSKSRRFSGLVHAVDIFATVAGGMANIESIQTAPGIVQASEKNYTADDYLKNLARPPGADIDGINLWPAFQESHEVSPAAARRAEVLLGMDYLDASLSYTSEPLGYDTAGLIVLNWKILVNEGALGWYSVPSLADAVVRLDDHEHTPHTFLFDLESDPNETTNLAAEKPELVNMLLQRLVQHRKLMVPCEWRPLDPNASFAFTNYNQGFIGPWRFQETLPLSENCANHMGKHDISRFRPPPASKVSSTKHLAAESIDKQQHPVATTHPNVVDHPNLAKATQHQEEQAEHKLNKKQRLSGATSSSDQEELPSLLPAANDNNEEAALDISAVVPGRERFAYDW